MIFSPLPGTPLITQGFGGDKAHYVKYGLQGHDGIDLRAAVGTPVYAAHEGYIRYTNEGSVGYGKGAFVTSLPYKHGFCRQTIYGHLSRFINYADMTFISAGDLVGYSGATGDVTGPHLHFGYRLLDEQGNVINDNNGYHGWFDISPYTENWLLKNVLQPS